jgi:type I restriction enzyme S subunit
MKSKYNNYKKTNISWLESIPKNWDLLFFNSVLNENTLGCNKESSEGFEGIPLIKMVNLQNGIISLNKLEKLNSNNINDIENKKHILKKGDILFNTRNSLELVGKTAIWKNELPIASYNSNLLKFKFNKKIKENRFMIYILNSPIIKEQLRLMAKGTTSVAAIYFKDLKNLIICIPSKKEQTAIANYLDKKTSSIDDSIETLKSQKERLIEQKKAIIHKAVTKGLDNSVEMKDSGVEWIGDIPKSWEINHLKRFNNYDTGNTPDSNNSSYYSSSKNNNLWANISDLGNEYIYDTKKYLTKLGLESKNFKIVEKNSLLYSFKLSVGVCSINKVPMYSNEAIAVFNENKKTDVKFLYYSMKSNFYNNSKHNIYGAKLLNRSLIENGWIVMPNKNEQIKIVKFLDNKVSKIDESLTEVDKQMGLLNEYKKTLINDVVTGKVKVI